MCCLAIDNTYTYLVASLSIGMAAVRSNTAEAAPKLADHGTSALDSQPIALEDSYNYIYIIYLFNGQADDLLIAATAALYATDPERRRAADEALEAERRRNECKSTLWSQNTKANA